ncbi:hypothetical protein [Candidatus Nitrosocosmicus sp. SS]|jgi:hypothetical protein|uniref:hypothetical protein n=1 Tax=Candidatus Nitrosocosmicus agrestis TaxID=2563600 RepID=UPI00122E2E08|nr:hypothetical protein [Candidatus Nitrosocosmicus sp. SS]KAA2280240.1 hypothetical protein F1Z66_11600 [Candidatus Nitrosocosmicus sp. SS]KAF0869503.1 hypothetical protein E5N71_04545 [Candidatus Nitrosocosmicus sp. SS]
MVISIDVARVADWIKKGFEYFKPYKGEYKNFSINYEKGTAEMQFLVHVPSSIKNQFHSVVIPYNKDFVIKRMHSQSFSIITGAWYLDKDRWKLNTKNLPGDEKYYITLEGKIDPSFLDDLVWIQRSANRDSSEKYDKYWLRAVIKNVHSFQSLWSSLEIEDVNIGVDISIMKAIATSLPSELSDVSMKTVEFVKAGQGNDRNRLYAAWRDLYKVSKNSKIDYSHIIRVLNKISDARDFDRYLSTKPPFYLGPIRRIDQYAGYIPQKMSVEVITRLSLTEPKADGVLLFKKADYSKYVENELGLKKLKK